MSETPEEMLRRIVDDDPRNPKRSDPLVDAFAHKFKRTRTLIAIATVAQVCLSIAGMIVGLWLLVQAKDMRQGLLALFVMLAGFETSILVKLWYWISVTRLSLAKDSKVIQLMVSHAFPAAAEDLGSMTLGTPSRAYSSPEQSRVLTWAMRLVLLAATLCLVAAFVMGTQALFEEASAGPGLGRVEQFDEWTFGTGNHVNAASHLTFTCVSTPVIRLTLPYAEGSIESVRFGGRPAAFARINWREYEVEVPVLPFKTPENTMDVVWKFPVTQLYQDTADAFGLRTQLRSFMPVVFYELNVVLDPESTFKPTRDDFLGRWTSFRTTRTSPGTSFGSCGLGLMPKDSL